MTKLIYWFINNACLNKHYYICFQLVMKTEASCILECTSTVRSSILQTIQSCCITTLYPAHSYNSLTTILTSDQLLLLLHPFNGLFLRTIWVSQYQKGKTSLDLNEARDDGISGCNGISWTIRKQLAGHSRQITRPIPPQWLFTGCMLFLAPNQPLTKEA